MRTLATNHRWVPLAWITVAALAVLPAPAGAQLNPLWDHYKVYLVNPPVTISIPPVTLIDQFTQFTHTVQQLERFANPTEKTVLTPPPAVTYPINDPDLHYAWWRISPQPFTGLITTTDQFGDHTLDIFDAVYLLNPALKSLTGIPTGDLPSANHYKCYNCQGSPVDVAVRMTDQFGPWDATVLSPRLFCNPVEKRIDAANVYPILDPEQHYTCYEFQTEDPHIFGAFIKDQFTEHGVELGPSRLLCVPTLKHGVTSTGGSTWGKIKVLYR